jgi:hypothetical protein
MKSVLRHLLLLCLFCSSLTCQAWNTLGHMVIAEIAYQQLTPKTRGKIEYLVTQFNHEYPKITSFMELAYWPDTLRGQKIQVFARWHYIDQPISFDNTLTTKEVDTDNAVWAIDQIQNILKNNRANSYDRARFLAFFAHIVGDLHQPLHTVSLFSEKHSEGDKGGNLYSVWYNNKRTNLHALWDKGVGAFDGYYSKVRAGELAEAIMSKYPLSFFGDKVYISEASTWASEGKETAKKSVYNTVENESISLEYEKKGKDLSEQAAALAGYRLGMMLNQIFDSQKNKYSRF